MNLDPMGSIKSLGRFAPLGLIWSSSSFFITSKNLQSDYNATLLMLQYNLKHIFTGELHANIKKKTFFTPSEIQTLDLY